MVQVLSRYIDRRPNVCDGRPMIKGTRIPVASLVTHYRAGMSLDDILAGYPNITPAQLFDALSYYFDNKDEIDQDIE
ncbi:MAG TPA: DUF433 domain-containing protein [Turneriella sp.]|nr:DUF433 domain-containing protein [Turneriella sp.]